MSLQEELVSTIQEGTVGQFDLNVVVREVQDEEAGDTYYLAECLEIPGCVSEGATPEEARENIEGAVHLCLSVILEDAMRQLTKPRTLPDLRRVVKQERLRVHATAELQFA